MSVTAHPQRSFVRFLAEAAASLTRIEGWRRYGVAFGFGVLTATALAPYYALPALGVGLSGLVLLLDSTGSARRPRWAAFATGWAFGFGYFLFGMYWLAFAFLVQADQFAWMIPIAVPAFTGFLGLFFGAACLATTLLWRKGPARVFTFAACFALFEYARGTVLTGLPWNLVGQSFAGTALLAQPAAWVGPYGLSLLVVLLAVAPAAAFQRQDRSWIRGPLLWGLGGLAALLAFGAIRLEVPTSAASVPPTEWRPWLVVAQPNIPQRDKFDAGKMVPNFERLVKITTDAIPEGERALAVWPENAFPFLAQDPGAPGFFGTALPATTSLLTGTYRSYQEDGTLRHGNSAVFFGPTNEEGEKPIVGLYDKHHLVPFGEYLPFEGLLKAVGLSQLAPVGDGFTPGPGPQTYNVGGIRFAPLICYEDVFPLALYPKDDRPDLLVVVTNDAWFGDNAGPKQHLDISRLRVIESGLPMARSANTGISGVFDAKGRLLRSIPLYEEGVVTTPLPQPVARPFYDRVGSFSFALLLLLVASFPSLSGLARKG